MTRLVIETGKTQAAGSSNSHLSALVDLLAEGFQALETWRRRHKASQQFARI